MFVWLMLQRVYLWSIFFNSVGLRLLRSSEKKFSASFFLIREVFLKSENLSCFSDIFRLTTLGWETPDFEAKFFLWQEVEENVGERPDRDFRDRCRSSSVVSQLETCRTQLENKKVSNCFGRNHFPDLRCWLPTAHPKWLVLTWPPLPSKLQPCFVALLRSHDWIAYIEPW